MGIKENHEVLSSIIENLIGGIGVIEYENGTLKPLYFNDGFYRMLGYSGKEMERILRNIRANVITEDLSVLDQAITDVLKDDGAVDVEFRTVTMDGGVRWLQVHGNLYERDGSKNIIVVMILDITERKNVEEEMQLQAERLNILSESEKEYIFDYNAKTDVIKIKMGGNGLSHDEIIKDYIEKKRFRAYIEDRDKFETVFRNALKYPKVDAVDFRSDSYGCQKGHFEWYRANITSVMGSEGYVTRIVGRVINNNEKKLKEIELQTKADKDALTGLYNKGATTRLIENAMETYYESNRLGAILMIDLDNFKAVNDNLGHATGDEVLQTVGEKLQNAFKGKDIVGRIGGDEFMVFMQDLHTVDDPLNMALSLCENIRHTYCGIDIEITVTSSIGIAICPEHGSSFEELYKKADEALYAVKNGGKNSACIYCDN